MSVKSFRLSVQCPLCREENKAIDAQRCSHCGMLMMSNKDYAQMMNEVAPLIDEINQHLSPTPSAQRWRSVQPLLAHLEPYHDSFPFIKDLIKFVYEQTVKDRAYIKFQQMYRLNIFILFILILMPLGAKLAGAGPEIWGLLILPVFGWIWLGVILFRKKWLRKE